MKLKIKDLTGKNEFSFLAHLVFNTINNVAMNTLPEDRDDETEFELSLIFNNEELNVLKFTKVLEDAYDDEVKKSAKNQANELFEKFKNKYKSDNSNNAKLSKLQKQFEKANNMLQNINSNLGELT